VRSLEAGPWCPSERAPAAVDVNQGTTIATSTYTHQPPRTSSRLVHIYCYDLTVELVPATHLFQLEKCIPLRTTNQLSLRVQRRSLGLQLPDITRPKYLDSLSLHHGDYPWSSMEAHA
jgi:hypothetical protein